MALDTITLKEVLDMMNAGEIFSIAFRTCNKIKGTGGEYLFYKTACKHQAQFNNTGNHQNGERKYTRNPNHDKNCTRNIRVLPDGNIVTVHIRLIRRFNSKTVL